MLLVVVVIRRWEADPPKSKECITTLFTLYENHIPLTTHGNKGINMNGLRWANRVTADAQASASYFGGLLPLVPDCSQSWSDTCEIKVFQLVCERRDIHYYAFQKVVFGDLFAGLENEFNIMGLESVGFIISITKALSDTKLSFKHPNDTLKFNEILSPANI